MAIIRTLKGCTPKIAADAFIAENAVIIGDVEIGPGTEVGPHVVLSGPTTIGARNRIYPFCSIGEAPQDKKYANESTRLVIGDRNTIREFCTLSRGTIQDRGETRIGDDNAVHRAFLGPATGQANLQRHRRSVLHVTCLLRRRPVRNCGGSRRRRQHVLKPWDMGRAS